MYRWLIVAIATIALAVGSVVTYGMGTIAAFYQVDWQLTQFQTGFISTMVNLGPLCSMMIFGHLMDRYGEKYVIGLSALLLGITAALLPFANSYMTLLIGVFIVGIFYGSAQTGGSTVITKWFPKERRGLAMGIRQTGLPIGGAIAASILPTVYFHYSIDATHYTQAIIAISGALLFILLYKDPSSSTILTKDTTSFRHKLQTIKNNRQLYPLYMIGGIMISFQMIIPAHYVSFLHHTEQLSLQQAGFVLSLAMIGGVVGRIALAAISDRFFSTKRFLLLLITLFLTGCFTVLFPFMIHQALWLFSSYSFILGFFAFGWYSLYIVSISEQADERLMGLTISTALTINQLFIIVSPALFGLLVDWSGQFILCFVVLGFAMLILSIWQFSRTIFNQKEAGT